MYDFLIPKCVYRGRTLEQKKLVGDGVKLDD